MSVERKEVDPLEPERHQRARVEMFSNHSRDRGSTMNVTTYGLDLAKQVLQVHWVEPETGEVKRKALARADVSGFFARRLPGVVAMEACPAGPPTTGGGYCEGLATRFGWWRPSSCGRS